MSSSRRHFLVSAAAAVVSGCVSLPGETASISNAETTAADGGFGWGDELVLSAAELHFPKLSPIPNTPAVGRVLELEAGEGEVHRLRSTIRRFISVGRGSGTGRDRSAVVATEQLGAVVMYPERASAKPAVDYA